MLKLLRIFFTGLFVSFVGALPLGTQNLAAMQIAISDGVRPALFFSLGLVAADVFYIYLTLLAMQWIQKKKKLFKALQWATLAILVALAAANFYAALQPAVKKNVLLSNGIPPFLMGLLLNGINPMQIPFWLGWSTVLFSKKILLPRWKHYNVFTAGASAGFSVALLLFVFGGRLIADKISNNQNIVYIAIGTVFTLTAAVQLWKVLHKKDIVHRINHPDGVSTAAEQAVEEVNDQTP